MKLASHWHDRRNRRSRPRVAPAGPCEPLESRRLLSGVAGHSPVGGEFQIDPGPTTGATEVAAGPAGDLAVTWSAAGAAGDLDVFLRLYDAAGAPRGPAFVVNEDTPGAQSDPDVIFTDSGQVVVAWRSDFDSLSPARFVRRFDAAGNPVGGQVLLQDGAGYGPELPATPGGGFIVVAEDSFRRFNGDGQALEPWTSTEGQASIPIGVDVADDGSFVVAWWHGTTDIQGRRFDATGATAGPIYTLASDLLGAMTLGDPHVAVTDPASGTGPGYLVLSWLKLHTNSTPGYDALLDWFDPTTGTPRVGPEILGSYTTAPSLAALPGGGLVVTYSHHPLEGTFDRTSTVKRYGPLGDFLPPFRVGAETNAVYPSSVSAGPASRHSPAVAVSPADGSFVIVSSGGTGVSGSSSNPRPDIRGALYGQRFAAFTDPPASLTGVVWSDRDANGVRAADEPGRASTEVTLYTTDGIEAARALTDSTGHYRFDSLMPGQDLVAVMTQPSNGVLTVRDAGGDEAADSDFDPVTARSATIRLAPGEAGVGPDAGIVVGARVSGLLFNDLLRDGIRGKADPTVPELRVFADANGNGTRNPGEASDMTDRSGRFVLAPLFPGAYDVRIEPVGEDGWSQQVVPHVTLAVAGNTSVEAPLVAANDVGPARPLGDAVAVSTASPPNRTDRTPSSPDVASSATGNMIVVWTADGVAQGGGDASGSGVYARYYNDTGDAVSGTLLVNSVTAGNQAAPAVAMNRRGEYAVAWTSNNGGRTDVVVRRFGATLVPVGPEMTVNSPGAPFPDVPDIGMDAFGATVLVWQEFDSATSVATIFARRFDTDGDPLGAPFRVSGVGTSANPAGGGPAVAVDAEGNFVVVWSTLTPTQSIVARWFNADGTPAGAETRINTTLYGNRAWPTVAMDPAGDSVIAWAGENDTISGAGAYYRRFGPGGEPRGSETLAAQFSGGAVAASMSDTGDFVLAWYVSSGIMGQVYSAAGGVPIDAPFTIAPTSVHPYFASPTLAMDADGDFIAAYQSAPSPAPSQAVPGVYARRYTVPPAVLDGALTGGPGTGAAGESTPHQFRVRFSRDVSRTLTREDLVLTDLNTGQRVPPELTAVTYDGATGVATFTFVGFPGGVIADGRYRATIPVGSVADASDRPLAAEFNYDFAVNPATVAGRYVFYNNSAYDGRGAGADARDDAAVAPDKQALRSIPGPPNIPGPIPIAATMANVTSFGFGINGVMIDLAGLPAGGGLSADDFAFLTGAAGAPSTWTGTVPAPTVSVRRGAGAGGTDRVTLTWPNGTIKNTWLRVTVKADGNTRIAADDVFYFGNLVGETDYGLTSASGRVNAADLGAVKRGLNTQSTLTGVLDFNRDGRVNALDLGLAKANLNRTLSGLTVPSLPGAGPAALPAGAALFNDEGGALRAANDDLLG